MKNERRRCDRKPYNGRAYLTYGGRCRSDQVVELSERGLKLRSAAPIRSGKSVKIFLPLPGRLGWRLCMLHGKVVRRDRLGRGADEIAIELTSNEADNAEALEAYLAASA